MSDQKCSDHPFRLLLLIVLVGAGLRFYQLGHESLWLDEAASGLRAQMSWSQMFETLITIKGNPPLHYILLKGWADIFGHSELSLRFISAFFSTLSIVVFYRIAKLLFSANVALIAAALLALSRYHIDFAQEARCYALMGFLVLVSMYYLIRIWQHPTRGAYMGYILASAGMLYNHYYAPFVIITQTLFILTVYLFSKPLPWKKVSYWFAAQAAVGLCYIPWVAVLWRAIKKIESVPTILQTPGIGDIFECFKAFSGGHIWAVAIFVLPAFLSFYAIPKAQNSTEKPNTQSFYLILLWLVVPIMLPLMYSIYRAPIFSSRYTLISSYPFYLMIAIGIAGIRMKYIRWFLIGAVFLMSVRVLAPRYLFHNFEQWRQATAYIESKAQPGQILLFHAPFCGEVGYKFYAKRTDLSVTGFPHNSKEGYLVNESNINKIDSLVQDYRHVWLILSHTRDENELILEKMRQLYSEQEYTPFKGIDVYLFER